MANRHRTGAVKSYLDINVLEAARQRLNHVLDTFDSQFVAFSGGKDSLVCLHLLREEKLRRGDNSPVEAVFYDEELIPDKVLNFVEKHRHLDWINLRWYCIPMENQKFVLGEVEKIVTWDPNREWLRPMPEFAIKVETDEPMTQYSMNSLFSQGMKGRVAAIVGVRAAESLMRLRFILEKVNEPHIAGTADRHVRLIKPIYDWLEDDVFKYLGESGIPYCETYLSKHIAGDQLRVSTPLHSEAAKALDRLKFEEPAFFDRLVEVFPDITLQDRYYPQFKKLDVEEEYLEGGLNGCLRYIAERLEGKMQRDALKLYKKFKKDHRRKPEAFPPWRLLRALRRGVFYRPITAFPAERTPKKFLKYVPTVQPHEVNDGSSR